MAIRQNGIERDPKTRLFARKIGTLGTTFWVYGLGDLYNGYGSVGASPIELPFDCYVDAVGFWVAVTGTGEVRVAIYDDANYAPNNLLVESASAAFPQPVNRINWVGITETYLKAQLLWLAFQQSINAGYLVGMIYGVEANTRCLRSQAYGAFPNPFGAPTSQDAQVIALWARISRVV